MLYKLLSNLDRSIFKPEVISLTDIGPIGQRINALGIPVRALGMRRGIPNPFDLFRLSRWLKESRPDMIQTWMYHADLVGGLAAALSGSIPVIWGIRHSNLDPAGNKRRTIWTAKMCARLSSRLPKKIVCCSEASRRVHAELGYDNGKMVVIPNGFDLTAFKPNPEAKRLVRQELGIPEDAILIGMIGRFDPQKDQLNFMRAAALLHGQRFNVHFLLCGEAVTWENPELVEWVEMAGIREHCHLLGRRDDIPMLANSLDIATLSSAYGEGFSNVIGEAMACGIPCVATDVGDSALIIGNTGRVVASRDPVKLANAWCDLIECGEEKRQAMGLAARQRVIENFSLASIVKQYENLYGQILNN